jgi:hypothetical protein
VLCIIDLFGDDDPIFVTDDEVELSCVIPSHVPSPSLQIVPMETDEN